MLPEPGGFPPLLAGILGGQVPPLGSPLLPSPIGPPARGRVRWATGAKRQIEAVSNGPDGSEASTGALTARDMTGAFFPWRDPGEGEPAAPSFRFSGLRFRKVFWRSLSGIPRLWTCDACSYQLFPATPWYSPSAGPVPLAGPDLKWANGWCTRGPPIQSTMPRCS